MSSRKRKLSSSSASSSTSVVPHVKKLINDLLLSITTADRRAAIECLCDEIHHEDKARHGQEVKLGIISALCKHLSYVLNVTTCMDGETTKIVGAIKIAHTCSAEIIEKAFVEDGKVMTSLLIRLMKRCNSGDTTNAFSISAVKDITFVFLQISRAADLQGVRIPLVEHVELISTLISIIGKEWPDDARANCLGIMANLSCTADVMRQMARYPRLLDSMVETAYLPTKSQKIRHNVTAFVLNLTWAKENRVLMGRRDKLIKALAKNILPEEALPAVTRATAMKALKNLSVPDENLVHIEKYAFQSIRKALQDNNVGQEMDILTNATCILRRLSKAESIHIMAECQHLWGCLVTIALSSDHQEAKKNAVSLLVRMSMIINSHKASHTTLLDAIAGLSGNQAYHDKTSWMLLQQCLMKNSDNSCALIQHKEIPKVFASLLSKSTGATVLSRVRASVSLLRLSYNEKCREFMSGNKLILSALVSARDDKEANPLIVKCIINLVSVVKNRKFISEQQGVIPILAEAATPKEEDYSLGARRALMKLLDYKKMGLG